MVSKDRHKYLLEYWQKRRRDNPFMDRDYYRANRQRVLRRVHEYYQRNRESILEKQRSNRDICNARKRAEYHIPLKSMCELCGSKENLHRHHPDYSKALEIVTLCASCHKKLHAEKARKEA